VTFIDEYSNWVTIFVLKRKSDVAECYLKYEASVERQTGNKIRALRSDRGGEYLSDFLKSHFESKGISHELTAAYTPHQNGIAERMNRTLLNLVRSMLFHMKVPKRLWAEALSTAVYVRNRVTGGGLPSKTTPHHFWKRDSPSLSHVRVFGCKCWYAVPKSRTQKLDARAKPAIFVGYAENSKAYKLIDLETRSVVVSRDVTFDEQCPANFIPGSKCKTVDFTDVPGRYDGEDVVSLEVERDEVTAPNLEKKDTGRSENDPGTQHPDESDIEHGTVQSEINDEVDQPATSDLENEDSIPATDDQSDDMKESDAGGDTGAQVLRSGRVSRPPGSWWNASFAKEHHNALMASASRNIPQSYEEATTGPDAKFWQRGIDSEIASLKKYKTWKLVPRSAAKGRKVLTTRWVFVEKQKVDANGHTVPFPKGRNVVRGFEQVQGVDFGETFAPVVKYASVRALCSTVAGEDLEFHQMDATTAFLNGVMDEDVYIELPEGLEIDKDDLSSLGRENMDDLDGLDLIAKLEKSQYGTKQAPRCWNKKINSVLVDELI
jgi:hypothetical protein